MAITVNVTQYHIDNGERSNDCKCPVSLALATICGHYDCSTGYSMCRIGSNLYSLPSEAREFIIDFDLCIIDVAPFSFELEI